MNERSERELLTGWGGPAPSAADVRTPTTVDDLAKSVLDAPARGIVARGLGRAYNDAAQNAGGMVVDATDVNQPRSWHPDPDGVITLPAGVSLDTLLRRVVPQGYFVPVSPGTRFVTVGGALAADVHGKNHHRDGSFANHVHAARLALPSGEVVTIGPGADQQPELFWATAGGMGLTGVLVDVTVKLPSIESSYLAIDVDTVNDLDSVMSLMHERDEEYHYSVAWIDL